MTLYTVQPKNDPNRVAAYNVEAATPADAIKQAGRQLGYYINPTDPNDQSFMLEAIPSEEQRPTIGTIARQIRCNLFAERATIEDATANAYNLIHTLRPQDRATALQALHVFANTIANAITTATQEQTA